MKHITLQAIANSMRRLRFGALSAMLALALLLVVFKPLNASAQDSTRFSVSLSYGVGALFLTPDLQNYSSFDFDSTAMQGSTRIEQLSTDLKIKPFLLKFDMDITPKKSIGLQLIYNGFTSSGTRLDSIWVPTSGTYTVEEKSTKYTMNRFRVQATFTWHFYHKNPLFESYFYTGVGWSRKYRKYRVGDEYPNYSEAPVFDLINFPVSIRFAYGFRFNFTERFGLQTEIGLGGPLLSIGLSAKF
ncbi:MAG: hypothetical protein QE487_09970 [Fluviicola sp.]|nr:hypothetical protein [Fluviicola sp.]